jgi:hypothetical protein
MYLLYAEVNILLLDILTEYKPLALHIHCTQLTAETLPLKNLYTCIIRQLAMEAG